jgi:hypothetical protein
MLANCTVSICSLRGYSSPFDWAGIASQNLGKGAMADNLEILNVAVSLLIRAALFAARFSGRVRQRSLTRLAAKDADTKAKEIIFLKDQVYQLEMQVSILQKHLFKKDKKPRYEVRERLLILWHVEAFQIPRRKVSRLINVNYYFSSATIISSVPEAPYRGPDSGCIVSVFFLFLASSAR